MKYLSLILFSAICLMASSCDKDDSNQDGIINSGLVGTWNAKTSSGGIAGISCVYQPGEIVLAFDAEDNLSITNNVLNTSAFCGGQELGISNGNYKYGVLSSNDKKYLLIDDIERGEILVTDNEFILNQNNSSEGNGADGFISIFTK